MIIYDTLKALKGTESEEQMARFIVKHTKEVLELNIEQFATLNYVSNSSVVRFCQKLGFKGYSDFKLNLALEINTFLINNQRIEVDMPILPNASDSEITATFLNLYHQTLADVHRSIDMEQLRKVARVLENASFISIWATGPSELIALDFYYRIKRLGYVVHCEPVTGFHHVPIVRRTDNEVALIISTYGNSHRVRQWVLANREKKVPVILITLNNDSPFLKVVEYPIIVDTSEKRYPKMGHFASRTAMHYVIDCLYTIIFNFNYEKNVKILHDEGESINARGDYLKNLSIDYEEVVD